LDCNTQRIDRKSHRLAGIAMAGINCNTQEIGTK